VLPVCPGTVEVWRRDEMSNVSGDHHQERWLRLDNVHGLQDRDLLGHQAGTMGTQGLSLPPSFSVLVFISARYYYFASATVAVGSSHMNASPSASWNRFSPPSYFVNGHMSTMWFMVCRWPQSGR